METKMERQISLKKLHFYIANYQLTEQEKLAVRKSQNELKENIQTKFKKSNPNRTYIFPRKYTCQEQYSNTVEIIDLKQPFHQEQLQAADKPKLKIKLIRPKQQNANNFQQLYSSFQQSNRTKTDKNTLAFSSNYKSSNQNSSFKARLKTQHFAQKDYQAMNTRLQTQHSRSKENYFTRAIKIVDDDLTTHGSLQRVSSGQRSKSKLNMLTKSYMNLKTSILDKQKLQQQCITIRSNDYKLMPSKRQQISTTNKSIILGQRSKLEQCQSTRVLNNITNQSHRFTNFKNTQKSCEKIKFMSEKNPQLTSNQRRFLKVK